MAIEPNSNNLREYYRSMSFHYLHELAPGDRFRIAPSGPIFTLKRHVEEMFNHGWWYEDENGKRINWPFFYVRVWPVA